MNRHLEYINLGTKTQKPVPESRIDEVPQRFPEIQHVSSKSYRYYVLITWTNGRERATKMERSEGIHISAGEEQGMDDRPSR
jgi:hypothetical protein